MNRLRWLAALALVASCRPHEPTQEKPVTDEPPPAVADSASRRASDSAPEAPADATPTSSLPEPTGPIDPTSAEAAGQVAQRFGALIEQGRWDEAGELWSDPASADGFARTLRSSREVHLTIGELGEPEGAAGSIYITQPVTFYGKTAGGNAFERPASVTLRRVNDVPGSTARQRRWHIQRIDWNG